jgi:hypothetical protein
MGKASKAKAQKRSQRRDRPALLESLSESREFLELSARAYDKMFGTTAGRAASSAAQAKPTQAPTSP